MTRAKQDRLSPPTDGTPAAAAEGVDGFPCMSVLVHGDAAFAGQGVVAETLNLSGLSGYRTGGTVHVVINNQLGFTTAPASARTSVYPTDVAKMVQAPIFHVNGDDPEACVRAARLAFAFRQTFHKDVVIDLVCYRKHGHNEGDDPSYTQPLMYQRIEAKRSVRKLYTETLVRRGDITLEEAEAALDDFNARLQAVLDEVRGEPSLAPTELPAPDARPRGRPVTGDRRRPPRCCTRCPRSCASVPDGFTIHPKLERQFAQRDELVADGQVDWALAEALAIGSLMYEGVNVRLTGQDTRRGTFSHRHAVLVDYGNGEEYVPLAHIRDGLRPHRRRRARAGGGDGQLHRPRLAALGVRRRSASSTATRSRHPRRWWPGRPSSATSSTARRSSSTTSWWRPRSSGASTPAWSCCCRTATRARDPSTRPPASSASCRCARGATCGSPSPRPRRSTSTCCARRRRLVPKRPLVVVTPKSMLRAHASRSTFAELETGSFQHVIDDASVEDPAIVRAHRAVQRQDRARGVAAPRRARAALEAARVAVVRVEQLYPWPVHELTRRLRALRRGERGGVAAGGAREHGRLVLRARPPARLPARALAAPPREPHRVGQSRHRQRRPAPAGAGRPLAAGHWLNRTHVVVDGSNLATEGTNLPQPGAAR